MQCNDKKIVDELRKEIQQKLDGKAESLLAVGLSTFLLTEHLRICDSHGPDVAKRVMDMTQRDKPTVIIKFPGQINEFTVNIINENDGEVQ